MSKRYKFLNPEGIYFITSTIVHWMDLFSREEYSKIVLENWEYCRNEHGLKVHAYIIMTNHVHVIVSCDTGHSIAQIMRIWKSRSGNMIIKALKTSDIESRKRWLLKGFKQAGANLKRTSKHKIWIDGVHPLEIFSYQILEQKLEYLHQNPVKAGYVELPEYWSYSSARQYMFDETDDEIFKVDVLELV